MSSSRRWVSALEGVWEIGGTYCMSSFRIPYEGYGGPTPGSGCG